MQLLKNVYFRHDYTDILKQRNKKNIINIVKSLEESDLWIKVASKTIEKEAKEQKWGFLSISLDSLAAKLLVNMLAGEGTIKTGQEV